jgi:putative transposase
VETYRIRPRRPSSPTWKTFLTHHVQELVVLDFLVVPTLRHTVLFVLVILAYHRRRVVHFNVTEHPTVAWTAQQVIEAFPWDKAPWSPWQNPYVERLIGSIRRECPDHVIVLHEQHLRRLLTGYFQYAHHWRTHRALDMDCAVPRLLQGPEVGSIRKVPEVEGLHHHYERRVA